VPQPSTLPGAPKLTTQLNKNKKTNTERKEEGSRDRIEGKEKTKIKSERERMKKKISKKKEKRKLLKLEQYMFTNETQVLHGQTNVKWPISSFEPMFVQD
jgi:ATP-dependent 26S proteasome regulatory subunit